MFLVQIILSSQFLIPIYLSLKQLVEIFVKINCVMCHVEKRRILFDNLFC